MSEKMISFTSNSEAQTQSLAQEIAHDAEQQKLYCLYGDLGVGKSVFARSFIQHLTSVQTEVPSPTFTILQTYDSSKGTIYHYDLYRLEVAEEIYELDWDNALYDGIVIVEWPQRLGHLLPQKRVDIKITQIDAQTRKIDIHDQSHHAG